MLIGRIEEQNKLLKTLEAEESQFVAVYGRRRIGKTFLIRETFNYKFCFEHTGVANQNQKIQLKRFKNSLIEQGLNDCSAISDWFDAFDNLKKLLNQSQSDKKVIFLDELAWMNTPKSNFISALENFWNSWCAARKDIVLIVCASATSWIIDNIIHDYGGLHNRITFSIDLKPFTLKECEEFSNYKKLEYSKSNIVEIYMILGGVPYYWNFLQKGWSVSQNIDNIFFNTKSNLKDEFKMLYNSLFKNPDDYISIIEKLSTKKIGLTRNQILEKTKLSNNGKFSKQLEDLENCGFIRKYFPFGKTKKESVYQLIDNFTIFYFNVIKNNTKKQENFWSNSLNTPYYNTWCGLAFERVCLQHISQIKKSLGISGIISNEYSFNFVGNETFSGIQIDLIIDRNDGVINILEMKYYSEKFLITKDYESKLLDKKSIFKAVTKTNKSVFLTLITSNGVFNNSHSQIFQNCLEINDLFL